MVNYSVNILVINITKIIPYLKIKTTQIFRKEKANTRSWNLTMNNPVTHLEYTLNHPHN
jgi:hypothetical protein